jgi:hypothetical protein
MHGVLPSAFSRSLNGRTRTATWTFSVMETVSCLELPSEHPEESASPLASPSERRHNLLALALNSRSQFALALRLGPGLDSRSSILNPELDSTQSSIAEDIAPPAFLRAVLRAACLSWSLEPTASTPGVPRALLLLYEQHADPLAAPATEPHRRHQGYPDAFRLLFAVTFAVAIAENGGARTPPWGCCQLKHKSLTITPCSCSNHRSRIVWSTRDG